MLFKCLCVYCVYTVGDMASVGQDYKEHIKSNIRGNLDHCKMSGKAEAEI